MENKLPTIIIDNVDCKLQGVPINVANVISKRLSVQAPNFWFSEKYKSGQWDGRIKFFKRPANVFPTGLIDEVVSILEKEFNLSVELVDKRLNTDDYKLMPIDQNYKISDVKVARDYQVDAVNKLITKNLHGVSLTRGIVNIATNGGKTSIATAFIKELYPKLLEHGTNFLFVTHSKEIARQAQKSIQNDLGIEVGFIGDGKWDLKPISVAIVTTLYKRLKKPEFEELINNTIGFVADECLSGNTQVLLPNNKVMRIKDICEREDITEVMSYNLEKNIFEPKKVLRKMITPATEQFWKVWYIDPTTGEEKGLTATRNHKIWTLNRGYVRVDELTTEDTIKINTSKPEQYKKLGYDCLYLTSRDIYQRPEWSKGKIQKFIFNPHVKISRISKYIGLIPKFKYNLEVEDNHNYIANGVLVSNCHHSSANSWYEVFNNLKNASIRIGLTGTVDKTNPVNEMKLYACTGSITSKVSNDYLIENGYSARPICIMFEVRSPELDGESYQDAYDLGIVESQERLDIITQICEKETNSHNTVLILVERVEHGDIIKQELEHINKNTYFTNGQLDSDTRQQLLDDLRNGKIDVLISTAILDEGVDVSGINAVIYARGGKSTRKLLQGLGRGLRKKADGSKLRFYDFIDDTHKALLEHSSTRYKILKAEQFTIKLLSISKYKTMTWKEIENV